MSPNRLGLVMVSPLVLKMLSCLLAATASNAQSPKDLKLAYEYVLTEYGAKLSEEDFEALQKEMTALQSRACEREADKYADRHCDRDQRSRDYDECRGRQYDRCERSYEGHPFQLGMDTVLGIAEDMAESLGNFISSNRRLP